MLLLFIFLNTVLADVITNIWQSLEITNTPGFAKPQDIRTAVVTWRLDVNEVSPYDVFTLKMPYVFRTKFEGSSLRLQVDSVTYANCEAHDGSYILDFSSLDCTITNAVNTDRDLVLSGSISFDFVFGAGGSSHETDLIEAAAFQAGVNEIVWSGYLIDYVDFTTGAFFPDQDVNANIFYSRTTPQNLEQLLSVSGTCASGIDWGTMAIRSNSKIDCSQLKLFMTSELNPFMLPLNAEVVPNGSIQCSDDGSLATATFQNLPEGYRVFIEGFVPYPSSGEDIDHPYGEYLECGDGSVKEDYNRRYITILDGISSGTGRLNEVVVVTSTWTGTYTRQTTLPAPSGASTITIQVDVPNTELTTTTTTRPWDGSFTTTTTLPLEEGTVITVLVETPHATSTDDESSEMSSSFSSAQCVECVELTEVGLSLEIESSSESLLSEESSATPASETYSSEPSETYSSEVSEISSPQVSDSSTSPEVDESSTSPSSSEDVSSVESADSSVSVSSSEYPSSETSSESEASSANVVVLTEVVSCDLCSSGTSVSSILAVASSHPASSEAWTSLESPEPSTDALLLSSSSEMPIESSAVVKSSKETLSSTTTTFTQTWSNTYTSTYTFPYTTSDHTITVVVNIPEPSAAPEATATVTTTTTWFQPHTSTTTFSYTSGDKTLTVCVHVPFGYFNSSSSAGSSGCDGCVHSELSVRSSVSEHSSFPIELTLHTHTNSESSESATPLTVVTSTGTMPRLTSSEARLSKIHTKLEYKLNTSSDITPTSTHTMASTAVVAPSTSTTTVRNHPSSQELSSGQPSTTSVFEFKLIDFDSKSASPIFSYTFTQSATAGEDRQDPQQTTTRFSSVTTQSYNHAARISFSWGLYMFLVAWVI